MRIVCLADESAYRPKLYLQSRFGQQFVGNARVMTDSPIGYDIVVHWDIDRQYTINEATNATHEQEVTHTRQQGIQHHYRLSALEKVG